MSLGSSNDITRYNSDKDPVSISTFPMCSQLETPEQIRGFELLRLASFVLKLRKFEQRRDINGSTIDDREYELRCSLLRHAIFQQVLTLTALDAREQAMQLIDACRKSHA